MLKVLAKCNIKEGKIEEYKAVANVLVDATRKEEGNIRYELFRDVKNTNIFFFVEEWKDEETLAIHHASKHIEILGPQLNKCLAEDMEVSLLKNEK